MSRWPAIAVAIALLVVAGYTGWWFLLAAQARNGVEAWIVERRADGWTAAVGEIATGGFPGRLRLTLRDVVLVPPDPDAGWRWQGPELVAEASPLQPRLITVRPAGVQRFDVGPADAPVRLDVSAASAEFQIDTTAAPAITVEGFADALEVATESGGRLTVARLDARGGRLPAPVSEASLKPSPAVAVAMTATQITLPAPGDPPFGGDIARIALDATLYGPLEPGGGAAGLMRWRDAAGILEIARLEVVYGPVDATADGTVALDGDGQPLAALSTRIRGLIDALAALRDRGIVPGGAVNAASFVLAAVSRTPADGGRPEVQIGVTVQDRVVSVGPVSLFQLPRIEWR